MDQQKLLQIIKSADGVWGMVVKPIGRDSVFEYNADLEFPAASVGKVPIALYIFHLVESNAADLSQTFEIKEKDHLPGTGILQFLTPGLRLTLKDLLKLMLIVSDNTAAKFLARSFGPEKVNDYLKSLGFVTTQLGIHGEQFNFGTTSAREISTLLEGIYTDAFLKREYSEMLIGIMQKCENQLGIRRYLPRELPLDQDQKLEIANKGGALEHVRHDVGIVFANEPYIISVLSKELKDDSYKPDNAGVLTIARLSEEVYKQLR